MENYINEAKRADSAFIVNSYYIYIYYDNYFTI